MDVTRAMQNWNVKYVDVARSPESALRMFTRSERPARRSWKIGEEDRDGCSENWKLLKMSEMGDSKVGNIGKVRKLVQKIEMGDPKTGKLVRKIEMSGPQAEKLMKKM